MLSDVPGSVTDMTRQTAIGSFGCRMRARRPTLSGPASRRSTLVMLAVQSGQCSTSRQTDHTSSGGASMSIVSVIFRRTSDWEVQTTADLPGTAAGRPELREDCGKTETAGRPENEETRTAADTTRTDAE